MKKKSLLLGLLCLLMMPLSMIRAFDAGQIREIINLTEYLAQFSPVVRPIDIFNNWEKGNVRTIEGASLSYDGAQVAWHGELREHVSNLTSSVICTHTFATLESFCYLLPDVIKKPSALNWSSDGAYVFFTGERIESTQPVDIWVLSNARGLLLNATTSNALSSNVIPTYSSIAPTWDAFNNSLYFIRDMTEVDGAPQWELRRITTASLEAAFARLSQDLLSQASQVQLEIATALDSADANSRDRRLQRDAYQGNIIPSDRQILSPETTVIDFIIANAMQVVQPPVQTDVIGMVAGFPMGSRLGDTHREMLFAPTQIDPGGLMLALLVNNTIDPNQGGLWLFDLTSGGLIPLMTVANIRTMEPDWISDITLLDLQWAPDSSAILFSAHLEGQSASSYHNIYHQSLLTMMLDPVAKYHMPATESEFFSGDITSRTIDSAVVLPAGELIYFNRSTRDLLYSAPIPPASRGSDPVQIQLDSNLAQQRRLASSVGRDNHALRVIIDFNLLVLQQ